MFTTPKRPRRTYKSVEAATPDARRSSIYTSDYTSDGSDDIFRLSLEEEINSRSSKKLKIAIAGGGAGGIGAALELAKSGYQVDIYEKNAELLSGTSNKTPGRAGHGYHYVHLKTAELYLKATIQVVKRYPGCLLGSGYDDTHYLRHGLYCIMKQKERLREDQAQFASIYPKEMILETYRAIQECYRSLVAEDPSNQVFGDPDKFHHVLSELEMEKYRETINLNIVDTIVDTREELLNWPKLRSALITEIASYPNIKVHLNSTIDSPRQRNDRVGFNFTVNGKLCEADVFINATWEGIEKLNQKIFIHMEPDSRTNRLKTIIRAKLPINLAEHPSVFFCMGPHAMISNMGDGTVMSTYAQVTNVSSSTGLFISDKAQQCLDGIGDVEEEIRVANQIIDGVSQYFPPMHDARLINKGYGIIKTRGTVDLFDPNSEVNKREEIGVEEQLVGWIDNACMKLLHFILNGQEVLDLVKKMEYAQAVITIISNAVISQLYPRNYYQFPALSSNDLIVMKIKLLKNMLLMVLQRYTDSSTFKATASYSSKQIITRFNGTLFHSMDAKKKALREIPQAMRKMQQKPSARKTTSFVWTSPLNVTLTFLSKKDSSHSNNPTKTKSSPLSVLRCFS